MGRFISRDPIRYAGQDINLYRFVGNNPFGGLDPKGLKIITTKKWVDLSAYLGWGIGVNISESKEINDCPNCVNGVKSKRKERTTSSYKISADQALGVGGEVTIGGYGFGLTFKAFKLYGKGDVRFTDECDGSESGGGCTNVGLDIGASASGKGSAISGGVGLANALNLSICTSGSSATGSVVSTIKLCFTSTPSITAGLSEYGLETTVSEELMDGRLCWEIGTVDWRDL